MARPLKFKTVEELQGKIDAYFAEVEKPKHLGDKVYFDPLTITGLALALGTSRETLCNYEERDEFFDTIKAAKTKVEHYAEKMLFIGNGAAGPIFALKNHGWSDKTEIDHSGKLQLDGLYGIIAGSTAEIPENRSSPEGSVLETE